MTYYPQSNGRAEVAVKSAKRILIGNIRPVSGEIDTEEAARALMTHRNTPTQDTGIAPSVTLFGYLLRDHLPNRHRPLRKEWGEILEAREDALGKRQLRPTELKRTDLQPLLPGDSVQIQNQYGNLPKRWRKTGFVAEGLPNRQYRIVVDGSRRTTLRNWRFLRHINPVCRKINSDPQTATSQEPAEQTVGHPIPRSMRVTHMTREPSQYTEAEQDANPYRSPTRGKTTHENEVRRDTAGTPSKETERQPAHRIELEPDRRQAQTALREPSTAGTPPTPDTTFVLAPEERQERDGNQAMPRRSGRMRKKPDKLNL